MAHLATKRFNYWSQLGILTAFCGAGLMIGGVISLIPLIGKIDFSNMGSGTKWMDDFLVPQNAGRLRWMQFISTLFLFFIPPAVYALICHKKAFQHLGFNSQLNFPQVLVVLFVMLAAFPVVSALQELTEMLPWSKATLLKFKEAEIAYNKQVAVIARMDNFGDYLLSVLVIAFLPAVFEETLFRGGIQNLFSRWFKMPILAIILTSIVFSAIHLSYLGFLSRFALGFVLGWFYYRTGNIWLSIFGHFVNNGVAVTVLYFSSKPGQAVDPTKIDDRFPLIYGLVGLAAIYGLSLLFEKASGKLIDQPGEEVKMPGVQYTTNPFENDPLLKENNA
ncbi:MAG: CPBP family intramembrane metalloprotease [Ferruginibacter sp.]|nr:CPBP family intramembrane metalloprotease [Ferruginibacter sp.]